MTIKRRRRRPRIELVPMIDTMFFVLVFFVVASVSMVQQRGLRVELPRAQADVRPARARITVTVDREGALLLEDQPLSLHELGERLRALLAAEPERPVFINADRRAEHGAVVAVMEAARRAGARSLTIGARPGEVP